MKKTAKIKLSPEQSKKLLLDLKTRFEKNMGRHKGLEWSAVQKLKKYDLKTSSWIQTPDAIRKLGGALFCDRRYDTVFVYHNGASSYYAVRGFRGMLKV